LTIIDYIDTLKDGSQKIKYRELNMPLATLFATNKLIFINKSFARPASNNGICR
jgi:hypothetical protein